MYIQTYLYDNIQYDLSIFFHLSMAEIFYC